ncbi:unnamed protein product [Rhizophagus irregularis]|nr:unnamed protein product [Rhizophagus irregularis]
MSCSKIFSGDLPELTYEVIKYFQNDILTLYSCILVNRLWCRLATQLLWENPFSVRTENYDNYIEIYLQYLNDDFKTKLKEYNIINNSLPSNTLFNYYGFLKYLNINKLIFSVINWLEAAIGDSDLVSDFIRLASDICVSLVKLFIENEVNLDVLEIDIKHTSFGINYDDILELILQNTNFIHNNIKNLNFYIGYYKENKLLNNRILPIIKLHQNLKKVSLDHDSFFSYQSLLLSKDYNCSNTLSTIIFYYVDFEALNLIENIKHNLNYLTISIHDNNGHNSIILQKLGKIIPLKLEYLHLYLYYIKAYDFEVFLKSSQDTFTKKLLISNITKGQDILPSIKTYIMKKRRVKYLAINGALFRSEFVSDELFSLEDEVKEFMLYDIKVKSYYGLAINMDDFMKEVI